MRKLRSDRYEAQLGKSMCESLYQKLLEPNADLQEIQHQCPPWKSGPNKDEKPSIRTLLNMTARARAQKLREQMEDAGEILQVARLQAPQVLNVSPNLLTNQICNLLAQEILEKTVKGEDPRIRASLFRLLLDHQRIQVEKMRWQRYTVEDIAAWYHTLGPNKEYFEKSLEEDRAHAIKSLGMLIYGEEWGDAPRPLRLNNGTIVYPEGTGPKDWTKRPCERPVLPGPDQPLDDDDDEEDGDEPSSPSQTGGNPPDAPPGDGQANPPTEPPANGSANPPPEPDITSEPPSQTEGSAIHPDEPKPATTNPQPATETRWEPVPGSKYYNDYHPMSFQEIGETFERIKQHKERSSIQEKAAGRLKRRL